MAYLTSQRAARYGRTYSRELTDCPDWWGRDDENENTDSDE